VTYSAGQTIFSQGDPGNQMFIVLDGTVDIVIRGKSIATLDSGNIFGEMALIDKNPRSATALAKTDVRLAAIDEERFMELVKENPRFALRIMSILAARLRRMDEKI
jgi:CRP-like cAMP-binding protein